MHSTGKNTTQENGHYNLLLLDDWIGIVYAVSYFGEESLDSGVKTLPGPSLLAFNWKKKNTTQENEHQNLEQFEDWVGSYCVNQKKTATPK